MDISKGGVETGETEPQTALREIKEETGLDRGCAGFRQSRGNIFQSRMLKKQVVYFLASPDGTIRCAGWEEEISEYKWCLLDEADTMVTF